MQLVTDCSALVLGFKAPWCPQCVPQKGVVERISDRFGERMAFAYVDLNEEAAEEFKVASLPTLLLYRDGKLMTRLAGFTSASKLISSIDSTLQAESTAR